ncbi:hypothetical protein GN958_ATG13386 [Phytophthora infestans]|uniref:Uncharacterized protein n=1 Tax=Phytophthora infestans TaxID=4787 RepID=A0A8S9UD53_PHYIN|nr:hypothetical protein GN958_ATG13386 [Phytophthora infestans]
MGRWKTARGLPASQNNDMTTFINLPGASAKKWLGSVGAKAVSTFYGRITDSMCMDPLSRLQKEMESVSGLACFSEQQLSSIYQGRRPKNGSGASGLRPYLPSTDALRTLCVWTRWRGYMGRWKTARGLPASQNNDMTTFINLPGASAKKWLGSVGAKAVSTFYGRITDSMCMEPLSRLQKEMESVSGLACFSEQQLSSIYQGRRPKNGSGASGLRPYLPSTDALRTLCVWTRWRDYMGRWKTARGLPASQNNDMTTFINLAGASAKKWLGSVGTKAVSTFYGRIMDTMRMGPLAMLHGEVENGSGLACFSEQQLSSIYQGRRPKNSSGASGLRPYLPSTDA